MMFVSHVLGRCVQAKAVTSAVVNVALSNVVRSSDIDEAMDAIFSVALEQEKELVLYVNARLYVDAIRWLSEVRPSALLMAAGARGRRIVLHVPLCAALANGCGAWPFRQNLFEVVAWSGDRVLEGDLSSGSHFWRIDYSAHRVAKEAFVTNFDALSKLSLLMQQRIQNMEFDICSQLQMVLAAT